MIRSDWSFMLDESACQDEITARFPRTTREAFGHNQGAPLTSLRMTFLPRQRNGWLAIAAVVAVLAFFVITGASK